MIYSQVFAAVYFVLMVLNMTPKGCFGKTGTGTVLVGMLVLSTIITGVFSLIHMVGI